MSFLEIVKAEWLMLKGELKQYYVNYIFYNLGLVTMFIGLFYSLDYKRNSKEGAILLVGLVMWQLCTSALSYFAYVVTDEATMGTLEQIFMTRTSLIKVLIAKATVNFGFNMFKAVILFLICGLFFQNMSIFMTLGFNNLWIILIVLIVAFSFYILGLLTAGLALFFKRVGAVTQILNYILLFFSNITSPISALPAFIRPISYTVTVSWGMALIRDIITYNDIGAIGAKDLLYFGMSFFGFTFMGMVGFSLSLKAAKEKGKLGHY